MAVLILSEPLYGLSGTLWPIHLKPQPDELLSSWIIRLAHAHGYKVQTMCAILFGRDSTVWNRDVDRLAPKEIVEILARVSGATIEQIENSTLRAYEGTLFERHNANGMCRWIVPLGIFHRSRRRPGLMCCPQCLEEDAEPYFRRRWRLAFSIACTRHGSYLLDACPECKSPLAPHRSDMQGRQVYPRSGLNVHCWKCGFDLRMTPNTKVLDDSLVELQVRLDIVLANGYADWAGNPAMQSIIFFDGLRELIAGITSAQTQERLIKSAKLSSIDLNDWPHTGLEMASLPMRRELFRLLAMVLEGWPENFIDLIQECKLRYADLKGDSEQRPFWYEDVIRREAGGGYAPISEEEAGAIASAVEVRYGRFSGAMARALSGREIYAHMPEHLPKPVSDDVYEDLLTSIDHQVAGTLDKTERACLIRDKVMFAAGRQLRLSEGALAELTLGQVRALVPEAVELDFSDVPRSPAQARAWVEWYWDEMRPQLQPEAEVDRIFTSAITRRAVRHSTVGARFQSAVECAMLQRVIPSYGCWHLGEPRLKFRLPYINIHTSTIPPI